MITKAIQTDLVLRRKRYEPDLTTNPAQAERIGPQKSACSRVLCHGVSPDPMQVSDFYPTPQHRVFGRQSPGVGCLTLKGVGASIYARSYMST